MLLTLPGILSGIIENGNREGIFKAKYPYESMEMLVAYVSAVFDGNLPEISEEEYFNKLLALQYNIERMLGIEVGAFLELVKLIAKNTLPKVSARAGRVIFMKDGALESEIYFDKEDYLTRLKLINEKMSALGI